MSEINYVFGPVPSRRLGRSVGISPIPKKTCNYSCIFCQLGRTDKMSNTRKEFFPLSNILDEVQQCLCKEDSFDVVSIVGEGEPTLYARLGELIQGIRKFTGKPIAVITNGALLYDAQVRRELMEADIVLPSLDSFDDESYRRIDRPYGRLNFAETFAGLVEFSHQFQGQIFMELMLMEGINDDPASLQKFKELLKQVRYDKVYINTPVRPPAEPEVNACSPDTIQSAADFLGGISIDALASGSFRSDIPDDYEAIRSIIGRHPMNQHEIGGFLSSRKNAAPEEIFSRLEQDPAVELNEYKGYITYRLK